VTGVWRKLHNEELHNLYSSPRMIKSRRMRWAGHAAQMKAKMNAYRIFVVKPEGKKPVGWPRCRGADDIKIYLRETGRGGMDWTDLAQDRVQWRALVNMVINF
jgi:hypothetical protein